MRISAVVEGLTDEPVVRKLAAEWGLEVAPLFVTRGKARLDANLSKYAEAASQHPYFVLRDLDHDATCAPRWVVEKPQRRWLCLRLAVREVEAWLMADSESFSEFFGIRLGLLPQDADAVANPKRLVVDLAQRSRKPTIKKAIVPPRGAHTQVGPGYEATLIEFAATAWRPRVAANRSESLRGARNALRCLSRDWRGFLQLD